MRKVMRYWVLLGVLSLLSVSSPSAAQKKGRGGTRRTPSFSHERIKRPSGWDHWEKKGWNSNTPPGIEKKGDWRPPGLSKEKKAKAKDEEPPGWSHGEKEGWEGNDKPSGFEKKDEQTSSKPEKDISPVKLEKKTEKELKQRLKIPED